MALAGKKALPIPDVTVADALVLGRWLAVTGAPVRVEESQGLKLLKLQEPDQAAHDLQFWPVEANRVRKEGQIWRVERDDWRLRLVPENTAATPAVRVLLTKQTAVVLDGHHWAHQATFTLYVKAGADLHLQLPPKAKLQLLTLDGVPQIPRLPEVERVWLPLPGGDGVRILRLRLGLRCGRGDAGAAPVEDADACARRRLRRCCGKW